MVTALTTCMGREGRGGEKEGMGVNELVIITNIIYIIYAAEPSGCPYVTIIICYHHGDICYHHGDITIITIIWNDVFK